MLVATATAFLFLVLPTGNASATPVQVSCLVGTANQAFSPPLTNTAKPTTTTITSHYGSCTSVTNPELTYGDAFSRFFSPAASCSSLLRPSTSTTKITWNTGETSTVQISSNVTDANGEVVVNSTGTVTSGKLTGSSVVRVATYLSTTLTACATTGLPSNSGAVTLTVLGR
ncbi:hypothetical protein K353_06181 [Kitasatospora sp. SolWspMP-SS2h]|uniref:hypothetical protein n=1 Tax=Kitasatospora sp. SolWspMP-SS2h TaxID=1305729 RepID=UPI000DBA4270|nr:hypothetical protein [Kitasatospora sp. SolWspMP-SS2h]RAJ31277.1 hypothetical protein K353_06181 [Kitasatospora sp. SolWspMP-SS2h]